MLIMTFIKMMMKFLMAIFLTAIQIIIMTMELAMISLSKNKKENKYK